MTVRRVPYRLTPPMPQQVYRTFSVHMPLATHWRRASCEEAGCKRWARGWKTKFVPGTPAGEKIRYQIKNSPTKRKYTVVRLPDRVEVCFPAGQECFVQDHPATAHKVSVQRPQIHVVRAGDWRTDARTRHATRRVHTRAEYWVEEFAENQDRLKKAIQRG
jgi:hypothetical protein